MNSYDHDLDIHMEQAFFGDIAKEESGPCPCCGNPWAACDCPAAPQESENEARERMTPEEREADGPSDPFAGPNETEKTKKAPG